MSTPLDNQNRHILTVSQLNRSVKDLLEYNLPLLWVEGELTNFAQPSSGHWYFTLKDGRAQVRCAMFKNRNMSVRLRPKNGDKVLLRARVSLYEGRGEFQLIGEHMEPAGAGDLQRQFEEIKARLADEGLFDDSIKMPLPDWPQKLGVVTSPTGAVIHDVLHVLRRRYPILPVVLLPVAVQGESAGRQIVRAIEYANKHNLCDVLIVGRGGGSLEDLWAFNEEIVARAISASRIPIVSAVGHETDFTIADFVADVRAPTPSAAAELVSPDGAALALLFDRQEKRLEQLIKADLQARWNRLQHIRKRLRHPGEKLNQQSQTLDRLELRLLRAVKRHLQQRRDCARTAYARLLQQTPLLQIKHGQRSTEQLRRRLINAQSNLLKSKQAEFTRLTAALHNLSPLNTLNRGFAIVTDEQGKVVYDSQSLAVGQRVDARVARGKLSCRIETITPPEADDGDVTTPK